MAKRKTALDSVEFTPKEMRLVVEPLHSVLDKIAKAVCKTIDYGTVEDVSMNDVSKAWTKAGDEVLKFLKVEED